MRLRIFVGARMFETHPLSIMTAPRRTSCLEPGDHALYLGVRSVGDWSKALNEYAHQHAEETSSLFDEDESMGERVLEGIEVTNEIVLEEAVSGKGTNTGFKRDQDFDDRKGSGKANTTQIVSAPTIHTWSTAAIGGLGGANVQVMLDGPYGGCSLDLDAASHILLLAGGSGITFVIGLLDEIVGRVCKLGLGGTAGMGTRTRRVDVVWCVRSFGALKWVSPLLSAIMERADKGEKVLDVRVKVFVTCLCDPESVPPIPNCEVKLERPSLMSILNELAYGSKASETSSPSERSSSSSCDLERVEKGVSGPSGTNTQSKPKISSVSAKMADEWTKLSVCAAGPEQMVREARNATARLALKEPSRVIDVHTEVYSI